jgi:hypothetical protein
MLAETMHDIFPAAIQNHTPLVLQCTAHHLQYVAVVVCHTWSFCASLVAW